MAAPAGPAGLAGLAGPGVERQKPEIRKPRTTKLGVASEMPEAPEILHIDSDLVVVSKPSGLLVHRGWADDEHVAMTLVRDRIGSWVYPVHRLDRGTSGVLLFGRSSEVAAQLAHAFEQHEIEKRYLALVRGVFPDCLHIDHPVPRGESGGSGDEVIRVDAITDAWLVARSSVDRCSLVEVAPRTGRLHQIRRHLRHANHPLIGDVTYGQGALNRHYRAAYDLHRLALHARSLSFVHPTTHARIVVEAAMPDDLRQPLEKLGLWPLPSLPSQPASDGTESQSFEK